MRSRQGKRGIRGPRGREREGEGEGRGGEGRGGEGNGSGGESSVHVAYILWTKEVSFVRRCSVIAVTRTNVFCLFRLQEKKEYLAMVQVG